MRQIDILKAAKIAVGCLSGYLIAEALSLSYSTSVITITLLSILNTRKETLQAAGRRTLAFIAAVFISTLLFSLSNYAVWSLFVYLFLYYIICQYGRFTEGFSMSTVLMLHLWKAQSVSITAVLNESFLMVIGISMGFLMNLYMPDRIHLIRSAQREIEKQIASILLAMSKAIFHDTEDPRIHHSLEQLGAALSSAQAHASYIEKNFVFRDMSYYSQYVLMRTEQHELLKRIYKTLPRIRESYAQTALVANFMYLTALSMHEYNNAQNLLDYLARLRAEFKTAPLPNSRCEFESRAVLYEIVNELHELILLKQDFSANLTPHQIQVFWKQRSHGRS